MQNSSATRVHVFMVIKTLSAVLCLSVVLCSTVQYSTVQCSTVQYSAVRCSIVQCSAVQYTATMSEFKRDGANLIDSRK